MFVSLGQMTDYVLNRLCGSVADILSGDICSDRRLEVINMQIWINSYYSDVAVA